MSAIYNHDVRTKIKYPLSRVMHGYDMAFIKDQKNDAILYIRKNPCFWFVCDDSTLDSTCFNYCFM